MIYTTHGAMTQADLADMADLYDWNAGQDEERAEEEAMEAAHAAHADECRACQEEASERETGARVALQMDTARRALEKAVQIALRDLDSRERGVRDVLETALAASREAIRAI